MHGTLSDDDLQRLYAWVDEISLSRPKRNIARDFSDGVLVAEVRARTSCVRRYNHPHVGLHCSPVAALTLIFPSQSPYKMMPTAPHATSRLNHDRDGGWISERYPLIMNMISSTMTRKILPTTKRLTNDDWLHWLHYEMKALSQDDRSAIATGSFLRQNIPLPRTRVTATL